MVCIKNQLTRRKQQKMKRQRQQHQRRSDSTASLTPIPEDVSCREFRDSLTEAESEGSSAEFTTVSSQKTRRRSSYDAQKVRQMLKDIQQPQCAYMLIESERQAHMLAPLRRSVHLEHLALQHATAMASQATVAHSVTCIRELQRKLTSLAVGENVQRGASVAEMHRETMTVHETNRMNVLGTDFAQVGIATVKARDNHVYMCQFFR